MNLSKAQLQAIKYYEGDVSSNDPFYGDPKAYVTINSLFYPLIETEVLRTKEGKKLNPAIIEDPARLIQFLKDLLSSFYPNDTGEIIHTYRVERYNDYLKMKQAQQTISFTSSATGGFVKSYADRVGIALMEFDIMENALHFDYQKTLQNDYLKTDEREILLPPGCRLEIEETELTEEEREIIDAAGNPPVVKCKVKVYSDVSHFDGFISEKDLYEQSAIQAAKRVYNCLNQLSSPSQRDVALYCQYKEKLRAYLLKK